jgi:hypothetical protein
LLIFKTFNFFILLFIYETEGSIILHDETMINEFISFSWL